MMVREQANDSSAVFEQFQGRLFAIAYRMTGTRADAEDIIQEAWLVSVVTRLSINRLRSQTPVQSGAGVGRRGTGSASYFMKGSKL